MEKVKHGSIITGCDEKLYAEVQDLRGTGYNV